MPFALVGISSKQSYQGTNYPFTLLHYRNAHNTIFLHIIFLNTELAAFEEYLWNDYSSRAASIFSLSNTVLYHWTPNIWVPLFWRLSRHNFKTFRSFYVKEGREKLIRHETQAFNLPRFLFYPTGSHGGLGVPGALSPPSKA